MSKDVDCKWSSHEGRAFVDLGLSVMWATCNIGATAPEEYGNYYAWGEISTKSSYTIANHYNTIYGKKLGDDIGGRPDCDAARANWGGKWRLPTIAEFRELMDNCIWTWTTEKGNNGYKITGPNGNSIFLPAAGNRRDEEIDSEGDYGNYWSSMADEQIPKALIFIIDDGIECPWIDWAFRFIGLPIRPVVEWS